MANLPAKTWDKAFDEVTDFTHIIVDNGSKKGKKIGKDTAKNILAREGAQLESVTGGTVAAPTVLTSPGTTEYRFRKASPGVYSFGSNIYTATEGKIWIFEWVSSTWSLKDMGALPDNSAKVRDWVAGNYSAGEMVYYEGQSYRAKITTNQEPSSGTTSDWEVIGISYDEILQVERDVSGYRQVIPVNENTNLVSESGSNSRHTYQNNAPIRNKDLKGFRVKVAQAGTMTVYRTKNVGTSNYSEQVLTVLNLEVGKSIYPFDFTLESDEYLSFTNQTDTGKFYFSTVSANPVAGGFYSRNNSDGSWTPIGQIDMSIGVLETSERMTSKRLDNIEKSISTLNSKNIAIVGDSISTYDGNIYPGNETYYPRYGVDNVSKTWWKNLADKTGAEIAVNDGWSGSIVSNLNATSLQNRLDRVPTDCNYLFLFIGINDQGLSVPLGEIPTVSASTVNLNEFSGAYFNALKQYSTRNSMTKIIVLTPLRRVDANGDLIVNSVGLTSVDYGNRIIAICNLLGIEYIDLNQLGINKFNHQQYLGDGLHPNTYGMMAIADFIARRF